MPLQGRHQSLGRGVTTLEEKKETSSVEGISKATRDSDQQAISNIRKVDSPDGESSNGSTSNASQKANLQQKETDNVTKNIEEENPTAFEKSLRKDEAEEYDVFKIPDASLDEYGFDDEIVVLKEFNSSKNHEEIVGDQSLKEDELIFEDVEDLGIPLVDTKLASLEHFDIDKSKTDEEIVKIDSGSTPKDVKKTPLSEEKKIPIKERLFNVSNAPGLHFLICLKEKDNPVKIECLLCKKLLQNKGIEQHICSKSHLLKVMEIELPNLYIKHKNDSAMSSMDLYKIIKKAEEGLPKQALTTTVTKSSFNAVKQKRLKNIEDDFKNITQKQNTPKDSLKVAKGIDSTPKGGFLNFKRVIIFTSDSYAEHLRVFSSSNLVEVHSYRSLTFQIAKEHIENLSKQRPSSMLYLLFLGISSFTNDVISNKCQEFGCQPKLKHLFLKEDFLNSSNGLAKVDAIVKMTKSFMKSLNNNIGQDSKLLIMPPIPVQLLTTTTSLKHTSIHDLLIKHPHLRLINSSYFKTLKEIYQYLCTSMFTAILSLNDCDSAAHPYTKYAEHVKFPIQVLDDVSEDVCIYRDWEQAMTNIICMVLEEPLVACYRELFRKESCIPKLFIEPKQCEGSKLPKKATFTIENRTFDHLVFIGNSKLNKIVSLHPEKLPSTSLIETEFPTNLELMMENLRKLKAKHKRILFFVMADVSLIGKKVNFLPCSLKKCDPSIKVHLPSASSSSQMEESIEAIVTMRKMILAEDDQWQVVLLPLFPAYGIHYGKENYGKEPFHGLMHSLNPDCAYLLEGSESGWISAIKTFKMLWTELSRSSFKDLHGEIAAFKFFIEIDLPLLRWQEANRHNLKSSTTEDDWRSAFFQYFQKILSKEFPSHFVNRASLLVYERNKGAANKAMAKLLPDKPAKVCTNSKDEHFKNIFLVGDPFFLPMFNHPAIVKKISYSLQNPEDCNVDEIIALIEPFESGHSACFLFFNASSITKQENSSQQVCYVANCRNKTVVSSIPTFTYARNKFYQKKNLVAALTKHLPTFVLPLYPSLAYNLTNSRGCVDHSSAHFLTRIDLCLCPEIDNKWIESFQNFGQLWNRFLEWNHKDYSTSNIAKKYIEEKRSIQLITPKVSDFHLNWSEQNVWKYFINAFLNVSGTQDLNLSPTNSSVDYTDETAVKLDSTKASVRPVQNSKSPSKKEATPQRSTQPTSGLSAPMKSFDASKQMDYKNIVKVENVSNLLPCDLFKSLALEVDGTSFVEVKEESLHIKLKLYESALIISRELDNLRVADCILKATIIISDNDTSQNIYIPKHQRVFPKIYTKFHHAIISNIKNQIDQARDPATFKMKMCPNQCSNIESCLYFHSNEDRRRNPFVFTYKARLCDSGSKSSNLCPYGGLKCSSSHNIYEQMLHPSAYQTVACPNFHKDGNCSIKPFCKFAHQNTPEMIFHKLWNDRVVFGLKNSIAYLVGSIRARCKRPDLRSHKNLFVSPDPEIVRLADESVKKLSFQHRLTRITLTNAPEKRILDLSSYQLVLGTLPAIVNNEALFTRMNRFCVLIIDDIATILNNPSSKNCLCQILQKLKMNEPNFSLINKVFVADENDDRGIKDDILANFDVSLVEISEKSKRSAEPRSFRAFVANNDVSPKKPSSPSPTPSPHTKTQGQSIPYKRPRSRSPSPPASGSKVQRKDISPARDDKAALSKEEQRVIDQVNQEFQVYRDVPEMHPDYEDHYEAFIHEYQKNFPKMDDDRHKEHYWKEFWKVAFVKLKSEEATRRMEEVRDRSSPREKQANQGQDEFTLKGCVDLLEDLKEKLGICEQPFVELLHNFKSRGSNDDSAIVVFGHPNAQLVLEAILEKLEGLIASASFIFKPVFQTAREWTQKLKELSKKNSRPNFLKDLPLDLDGIAKVTLGKGVSFIRDFIQSTIALNGLNINNEKDINDILQHVCDLQSQFI